MADQQAISEADVQSLAQKLTQFTQTLTPGEQAALAAVVLRGTPQGEDVEGFFDRRDRADEGAVGIQVGDPFSPLTNVFTPYSKTFQKGQDRPSERK
jgi:hypothetical protein